MHKTLCIIVLLVGVAHAQSNPPRVVAKGKLVNQTTTISQTTIFTPTVSGLYRISVYATVSTADPASQSSWYVNLFWTDDTGPQSIPIALIAADYTTGQFYHFLADGTTQSLGGFDSVVEAASGSAISYSITQCCSPDRSAYSLYYTVERLE